MLNDEYNLASGLANFIETNATDRELDEVYVEGIQKPNTYLLKVTDGQRYKMTTVDVDNEKEFERFYNEVVDQLDDEFEIRDEGISYQSITDEVDEADLLKPWKWPTLR